MKDIDGEGQAAAKKRLADAERCGVTKVSRFLFGGGVTKSDAALPRPTLSAPP